MILETKFWFPLYHTLKWASLTTKCTSCEYFPNLCEGIVHVDTSVCAHRDTDPHSTMLTQSGGRYAPDLFSSPWLCCNETPVCTLRTTPTFRARLINSHPVSSPPASWGCFQNYKHTHKKGIQGQQSVVSKSYIYKVARNGELIILALHACWTRDQPLFSQNLFLTQGWTSNVHLWFQLTLRVCDFSDWPRTNTLESVLLSLLAWRAHLRSRCWR